MKVAGQWAYLYRAIEKNGETIDFMLLPRRTAKSARGFKTLLTASATIKRFEVMRMIREPHCLVLG